MILTDQKTYNGDFIHSRFSYKYFRDDVCATGNVVAFVAPVEVTLNLIDLEDALAKDYIYSDSMVNFCWEIPNLDPFGAVCFQRLFNTTIANILSDLLACPVKMKGDDIMVIKEFMSNGIVMPSGKSSVSITYSKNNVAIGHTGVNIVAGPKAPGFAYSTNMQPAQARFFQDSVIEKFYEMTDDIFAATTKIIG